MTRINNATLFGLFLIFIIETVFYNISYDILLVLFLLLTGLSIGSLVPVNSNVRIVDKILIRLTLGLGIVGVIIWVTTFYNFSYKSLYMVLSIVVITVRYKALKDSLRHVRNYLVAANEKNLALFPILFIFFILYLIAASYPIWQFDALAKHISIPTRILNGSHWDYNVLEFIGYGDYAILPHMYYLYLMALGGTKALVIFNMAVSFLVLLMLLRLASKIQKSSVFVNTVALLYLSTPLIYLHSNILYVDFFPIFFIFGALLFFERLSHENIAFNMAVISFMLGCSLFSKPSSIYITPVLVIFGLAYTANAYRLKKITFSECLKAGLLSILFLALPCIGALLVVWYKTGNPFFPFMNGIFKSTFFSQTNFKDPFSYELGFNVDSLLSMIFHTSRNIEIHDGALGYYLLLLFPLPIVLLFRRNKLLISLTVLSIFSYAISILCHFYNIRYMLVGLILAILTCSYVIIWSVSFVGKRQLSYILAYSIVAILVILNLLFIENNLLKRDAYIPNNALTLNENESVLSSVNAKNIRVLSNNDVLRGTFKGQFYTLAWYNTFFVEKLKRREILPADFLESFDYYLVDKRLPESRRLPPGYFSLQNDDIKRCLTIFRESDTHVLYKVTKDFVPIISESFNTPVKVNVAQAETMPISNKFSLYRIEIDAERIDDNAAWGRFQINWFDKNGEMVFLSLVPFSLDCKRRVYSSPIFDNIPKDAVTGQVYLTSHTPESILIHSVKVSAVPENILQKYLNLYNEKWPSLSL